MPYVKLDAGMLDSTIWLEDSDTCKVWVTMLMMAKSDGMVEATAPGIARRANLDLETTRQALRVLESPDEDSRSLDNEGRRITRVDGGYFLTNYEKYRNRDHRAAERKRRERARRKAEEAKSEDRCHGMSRRDTRDITQNVTPVTQDVTQAEAEAEADISTPNGVDVGGKPPPCPQERILELYREVCVPAGLPDVRVWNETRQGYLRARWRENPKHQSLDFWRRYFEHVTRSRFLTGRTNGSGDKPPFVADLEWLVRQNNFAKVVEGRYHRD